jgi:hypothetical protein
MRYEAGDRVTVTLKHNDENRSWLGTVIRVEKDRADNRLFAAVHFDGDDTGHYSWIAFDNPAIRKLEAKV